MPLAIATGYLMATGKCATITSGTHKSLYQLDL
jgi:hypothetical protein